MPTQPEPTLVEFIRYNAWANQQLLAACADLGEDLLTASIPGAYGSIRAVLRHLLRAEADYLNRINGVHLQPAFSWEEAPSLTDLAAYAAQLGAAFLETVQRVPPTQNVHEEEDGKTIDYQARQLFMQAVNHGIEHRTNITTFLNTHGRPVPELDGWGYLFAHPDRFALQEGEVPDA